MKIFLIKKLFSWQPRAFLRIKTGKTENVLKKYLELREIQMIEVTPEVLYLARQIKCEVGGIEIVTTPLYYSNEKRDSTQTQPGKV